MGSQVEDSFVHQVYDAISGHFSATRFAVWPKVREFIESIPAGAIVADVGCGNGKYFAVRNDWAIVGSDRSQGLAEVSAARIRSGSTAGHSRLALSRADVLVADGLRLPYRAGSFDAALCIAVLHHISSRERRLLMLRQLRELLRPGGRALVTVWATQQEEPSKTVDKWQPLDSPAQAFELTSRRGPPDASCCTGNPLGGAGSLAAGGGTAAVGAGRAAAAAAGHGDSPVSGSGGAGSALAGQAGSPCCQPPATSGAASQPHPTPAATNSPAGAAAAPDSPTTAGAAAREPRSSCLPGADYLVPWHLPFHRAGGMSQVGAAAGGVAAAPGPPHMVVDSKKGSVVFRRYYHLFDEGELDELVHALGGGVRLVESYYDKSNWCVVFERV